MRRAIRGAPPGLVIALERRSIGDTLAGDHAFKRLKKEPIVGLAGVRIAGALRRLDFFAQHRGPLVPAKQPTLVERHNNRKRLRLPRLAKHRPFAVARKAWHGQGRLPSRRWVDCGHGTTDREIWVWSECMSVTTNRWK